MEVKGAEAPRYEIGNEGYDVENPNNKWNGINLKHERSDIYDQVVQKIRLLSNSRNSLLDPDSIDFTSAFPIPTVQLQLIRAL